MTTPSSSPNQFDLHKFFNPNMNNSKPHTNPSPFLPPTSSFPPYSFPPQNAPFPHHFPPPPLPFDQQNHQNPQRSLSFPTPPLPPTNPNAGARLMALLSGPPGINHDLPPPPASVGEFPGALVRMPSGKLPRGRHLAGESVVYDVSVRLPGEVQPQLEVTPITKYGSDPQLVLGRQIAVNKAYICYGLKQGNIRVLNINTALRSLLRGHTQRVTDLAFFAEDVHLLASIGIDGRVYVWKISEGPDEEDKPQITGKVLAAIQVVGVEEVSNPRICWHCHKQEVLVVGIGKHILRIDTTKVGNGEAEEPLRCSVDKLIDGVHLVGKHDKEVTDLSMCQWMTNRLVSASLDGTIMIWGDRKAQPLAVLIPHVGLPVYSATFVTSPHRPDHIVLVTAGPQNKEVKLWASASEEGWLLPSDSEKWKCTQTLELKSSAEPSVEDAFFNQVAALSQAGLLLLANAKKNAIYAVHLEYGPNPESSRMDYIAEFTVTMPILSFTGTSDILPHGEHIVQVYCVQTQAIQQYALDLTQCLPPPLENLGLEKSDSTVSRDATAEGFTSLDSPACRTSDMPLTSSASKMTQVSGTESATVARYPLSSGPAEAKEISISNAEAKAVNLTPSSSDADIVCAPSPPLPLSPRLSKQLSDYRNHPSNFESGLALGDQGGDVPVDDYTVDRQMDAIHTNLSDVPPLVNDSRSDENKVVQDDESGVLNSPVMFKHPTHLVTPYEIIKAGSSPEANVVDSISGGEGTIQDVVVNNDMSNAEVEVKVVGEARSDQDNEFGLQAQQQNLVSDSKEKFFCSQASDLGIEMARECGAISGETYVNAGKDGSQDMAKDVLEKAYDSLSSTTIPPSPSPSTKGKKQKGKASQTSGPSSPSPPTVFNSAASSIEPSGGSNHPAAECAFPQIQAMQETINQLLTMQKEMQKQMTMMVAVPVTKEGRRLEASLGRNMEKSVKANVDALWARIQEENAKNEKLSRDRVQQITNSISNLMNKDLLAIWEKSVKKEMAAVGPAVVRAISPAIEKTISSAITESFQRGVGDKAVNQLDKSVSSKLEATVARQIQAQFQTTGKQVLQDSLKSSFEASIVPGFEKSCKAMFEQIDSTFQKGMSEHTCSVQQHLESGHTSLAMTLRDAINSASSFTQSLSRDLVEGQQKLLALAAAGANQGAQNPLHSQRSNVPLLHEKVEAPMDPTKELARLVGERKYEEAFTAALHRSDVSIVSWLCSQVDLRGLLAMVPLPLSQGVVLSLLQQLACDINNDRARKISWMTDVAAAINPVDSMIAMHVRPIFEQVYQILNHQRSLPLITGSELSSIRLLMHVINSMLMTCK